ncbi:MAG: hypothetical protein H6610_02615 [Ignavibacteriales bacterium]|nr:hypothetical protein [Ignavibacteriales bacterium]
MRKNNSKIIFLLLVIIVASYSCNNSYKIDDQFTYAKTRINDLQFSVYITAHAVNDLLNNEIGRREALSIFRCNGITKAYIEVYRSGLVIDEKLLREVKNYFLTNDIEVVGGIATVPGEHFGVKQEGKLGWFNWQNQKTQNDLKEVMKMSAEVFDEFIVDDFLCTADTSEESKIAKGDRSWSQYRRDLLTQLSEEIFIKPAKEVNPNIKMIIKYPQWYDRFHLFGYDLSREPQLFDEVWVGTETRGQYTQRYGFVQPYEGFINYSWIKDIAKNKIGGAWFDHGDCDKDDFIEQAYQSVLAGAKEIVIFNYFDFLNGHQGHHLLRTQFQQLADLAKFVKENPVKGITAYKPINSEAGGDLYLMDFIGMLGVPIIPVHEYPTKSDIIFLPTQSASDANITEKINASIENGTKIIFTTGFLSQLNNNQLFELAGLKNDLVINPIKADFIIENNSKIKIEHGLDLECNPNVKNGEVLLYASTQKDNIPFLIKNTFNDSEIFTLNTHTFSQVDFDKVGEVLLCPKPLGLLELPKSWVNKIRESFNSNMGFNLDAPSRVVSQPFEKNNFVIHNYNNIETKVQLTLNDKSVMQLIDNFSGEKYSNENGKITILIKPRSRVWLDKNN